MADPAKIAQLEAIIADPDISPEVQLQAQDKLFEIQEQMGQAWFEAGTPEQNAKAIERNQAAPDWSPEALQKAANKVGVHEQIDAARKQQEADEEAAALAQLDHRFDLVPQLLATQPATTHPGGDQAASMDWVAGNLDGETKYAYEPPVDVVRSQLLENPAFVRALRESIPPTLDEITNMQAGDPLYTEASDYMWRQAALKAGESGHKLVRYSRAPWLQPNGVMDGLAVKLGGAGEVAGQMRNSLILGVDDMAMLGAGRAGMETAGAPVELDQDIDIMGLDESHPQSQADVNKWTVEGNPTSYMLGQGLGAGWGLANAGFRGLAKGGESLLKAAGNAVTRAVPSLGGTGAARVANVAGRAATSSAAGAGSAALVTAGQEGVDIGAESIQSGELPTMERLQDAGNNIDDAARIAGLLGFGGSLVQQGSAYGAQKLRHGNRFEGLVGQTEPHVDYGLVRGTLLGPRLKPKTQRFVEESRAAGYRQPGDLIAEDIAPKIAARADERVKGAINAAEAESAPFLASEEGTAPLPMLRTMNETLSKVRAKHQPHPKTGKLVPVDKSHTDMLDTFNKKVDSISLEKVDGAIELTPEEAEAFLDPTKLREALPKPGKAAAPTAPPGGPASPFAKADDMPPEPTIEAHRTVPVKGDYSPPPEVPGTKPGVGPRRYPSTLDGHIPERPPSVETGPAQPALVEPPVPSRPSLTINPDLPAGAPVSAAKAEAVAAPSKPSPKPAKAEGKTPKPAKPKREPVASPAVRLRALGVKKVYVKPLGYGAKQQEEVLGGLQDRAGEGRPMREDWTQLRNAALEDRDARTLGGAPKGWSAMKKRHAESIGGEKAVEKAVAPGGESFKAVVRHGRSRPGEKVDMDRLRSVADESGPGVREKLDNLRALETSLELQRKGRILGGSGQLDHSKTDAMMLRAFPTLRALEGQIGPVGGGMLGRGALLGNDEAKKREKAETAGGADSKRARYERRREAVMKRKRSERQAEEDRYK